VKTSDMELSRLQAWGELSKKCTDADIACLLELARRISTATPHGAQMWLMRIARDPKSSERICLILATAIAELRCRREEIRETLERQPSGSPQEFTCTGELQFRRCRPRDIGAMEWVRVSETQWDYVRLEQKWVRGPEVEWRPVPIVTDGD
jgi:hypothetical protein